MRRCRIIGGQVNGFEIEEEPAQGAQVFGQGGGDLAEVGVELLLLGQRGLTVEEAIDEGAYFQFIVHIASSIVVLLIGGRG